MSAAGNLTMIAARAVANANALSEGRADHVAALAEANRIIIDLNTYGKVAKQTSVGEREIHLATGFLLQATERWARYLQYENEPDRAADWRHAAFAFVALVHNAIARECEVS